MALSDRVVVITGATGALGRVVSCSFAAAGARLALTGTQLEALEALADELGLPEGQVLLRAANLTRPDEARAVVEAVVARWGRVDVLLNLAGGWKKSGRLAEVTDAEWDAVLDLNLRTCLNMCRAVLPSMEAQGWGRIVNVGARAALEPGTRQPPYNVAKAAVVALTRSIAADYRRLGRGRERHPAQHHRYPCEPCRHGQRGSIELGQAGRARRDDAFPVQ
jgi:NAD(P)-dependent dehydrogenase (short-subunit alcohol dehydrogenase family)